MKFKILISVCIFLGFFSGNAMGFKCGNTFIREGIQSIAVRHSCGEPRAIEVVSEGGKSGKKTERWTYGPISGHIYFLYFKGGVLEKVESIQQR